MTTELIICPLCATVIHRHVGGRVSTRISIPSRSTIGASVIAELQRRAIEERKQEVLEAEAACVKHYVEHHRLRYSLWKRARWTWLMKWPQRKPPPPLPDQQYFELTFPS